MSPNTITAMEMRPAAHPPADILDGLRRRDADAVSELREMISRHLRSALRSRGVSDADLDDFVQDAAIRVLDGLDSYRGDASFPTWVAVVSVRTALTSLRKHRGRVERSLTAAAISESLAKDIRPVDRVLTHELRACLLDAVDHELTGRQREVIVAELNGVPQVCVAERLGMSANAVYKMSHDARKKLRSVLARRGLIADTGSGSPAAESRRAP